jgi:alpha-L-rhamnosidase
MKNLSFTRLILVMFTVFLYTCSSTYQPTPVTDLRTGYSVNPLGIDHARPLFSWKLDDPRPGALQTACRILVATSADLLEEGLADMWDSGKQETGQNLQFEYNGLPLRSSALYHWKVQVWDMNGKPLPYSETATFETAYLSQAGWKGKWITHSEDIDRKPAPLFRKELEIQGNLKKATAYVAGVGYHDLYINSRKVTDSFLEPGYTRYDRRVLYVTYDLTPYLAEGLNGMGVILGNGWYNVQTTAVWYFEKAPWRKTPRLLMDIRLEYKDGTVEFISTDETWKFSDSPMLFNSIYGGEYYDARLEKEGWSSAGFDDTSWNAALVTVPPGGILSAQIAPPITEVRELVPVAVYNLGSGRYLFDLGQNIAGVARLKINGKKGTRVTMRFGERINPDNTLNVERIDEHMRIPEGDHPFQTNIYILRGEGQETYTPRFTYHGYQYVEVTTEPAIELDKENITGLFLATGFERTGAFRCSNELLNKLYDATINSYLGNFHSIPTDCPHREKNGWTGDAHIAAELGLWNFNGIQPYRKWLLDLRDEQRASGELPGIVPTSGWGYHWGNGPAWDSALPIIAWTLYQFYGDTLVLRENYDAIKRYVDYLGTRSKNGLLDIGLGDWVSIVQTPVEITSTGYYYHDAVLLSGMAGILGYTADEAEYALLAQSIRNAFNDKYLDSETNRYKVQTQTAISCALFQGLVPETARDQAVDDLVALIVNNNYHPDFGLLGSKYVINVLREAGHNDIAYRMISNTGYPSWGHWITRGANTLWEDWDGGASLNHIFLGDFTTWYFKALGGINIDPASPGFRHFFLQPVFADDLSYSECSYNGPNGKIVSNWKRDGGSIIMDVVIPPNSEATFIAPESMMVTEISEFYKGSILPQQDSIRSGISLKAGSYRLILGSK